MNSLKNSIRRFIHEETGLETVEYAILLGLIVAGTIGVMSSISLWVRLSYAAATGEDVVVVE